MGSDKRRADEAALSALCVGQTLVVMMTDDESAAGHMHPRRAQASAPRAPTSRARRPTCLRRFPAMSSSLASAWALATDRSSAALRLSSAPCCIQRCRSCASCCSHSSARSSAACFSRRPARGNGARWAAPRAAGATRPWRGLLPCLIAALAAHMPLSFVASRMRVLETVWARCAHPCSLPAASHPGCSLWWSAAAAPPPFAACLQTPPAAALCCGGAPPPPARGCAGPPAAIRCAPPPAVSVMPDKTRRCV